MSGSAGCRFGVVVNNSATAGEAAEQRYTHSTGDTVDRRRIELQLRAVMVTYRIEQRRRDSPTMAAFRTQAQASLEAARQELERMQPKPESTETPRICPVEPC